MIHRDGDPADEQWEATLKIMSAWVGPVFAVLTFARIRWLLPMLFPPNSGGVDAGAIFRPLLPMLSWLIVEWC